MFHQVIYILPSLISFLTTAYALHLPTLLTLNNHTLSTPLHPLTAGIYQPTCIKLPSPPLPGLSPSLCEWAILVICEKFVRSEPYQLVRDKWIWTDLEGCATGWYLPEGAAVPAPGECEVEIYGSIYEKCAEDSKFNAGGINVGEVPEGEEAGTSGALGDEWPRYMIAPDRLDKLRSEASVELG